MILVWVMTLFNKYQYMYKWDNDYKYRYPYFIFNFKSYIILKNICNIKRKEINVYNMSVCINLYKVVRNVSITPCPYYNMSKQEFDEFIKSPYDEKEEGMYDYIFSDGLKHDTLELRYNKFINKKNSVNKINKLLKEKFSSSITRMYIRPGDFYIEELAVDSIFYTQGWFFKKSFFKKVNTEYIAITRKGMNRAIRKYIRKNDKRCSKSELYKQLNDLWIDNECIFIISF